MFALVDCNNFYVSCERLFRPDLTRTPTVVLSNNDGCVIARSNEIKRQGIPMGIPYFEIAGQLQRLGAAVFSSNYALYGDLSQRVMETLESLCPQVERYSIDEAFVEVVGTTTRERLAFGRQLKEVVERDTGIPVSVGIAPTKVLAKLANRRAKRESGLQGVWEWPEGREGDELLRQTELGDLWGVASRTAHKLQQAQIGNALELSQAGATLLRRLGSVVLLRIGRELAGESMRSLESEIEPPHTILRSRSFGRPLSQLEEVKPALSRYVQDAWRRLRRSELQATGLQVWLHTSRFHGDRIGASGQLLLSATDDPLALQRAALQVLERIWPGAAPFTRCGVMLFGLERPQASLFPSSPAGEQVRDALEAIQRKWGKSAIVLANTLQAPHGIPTAQHRSPRYTTRWEELIRVG